MPPPPPKFNNELPTLFASKTSIEAPAGQTSSNLPNLFDDILNINTQQTDPSFIPLKQSNNSITSNHSSTTSMNWNSHQILISNNSISRNSISKNSLADKLPSTSTSLNLLDLSSAFQPTLMSSSFNLNPIPPSCVLTSTFSQPSLQASSDPFAELNARPQQFIPLFDCPAPSTQFPSSSQPSTFNGTVPTFQSTVSGCDPFKDLNGLF